MNERQRLLALLEIYDEAIQQLYGLGDSRFIGLIFRLERRYRDADARLAATNHHPPLTPRETMSR